MNAAKKIANFTVNTFFMPKTILLLILFISAQIKAQETASFLFNKGFNYIMVDKETSIKYFTESLKKDPEFSLAYYYRGLANYKIGNYQLAIADFDKALISDKNMIKCFMYKGFAHQQLNQSTKALHSFETYLESKPIPSASDHLVVAKAKAATGDVKGALSHYKLALGEMPSEENLYRLFLATYENKEYKKSLELINQVIQLNPSFYGYYIHKGKVELMIKKFDSALHNFDLSIGLNPDVADSYYLKGNTLDTLGRFDEALTYYTSAIQLNPTDGTYYSKRGNTKMTLGNKKGACLDWTIAGKLGYYADFDKIKTVCEQTTIFSK